MKVHCMDRVSTVEKMVYCPLSREFEMLRLCLQCPSFKGLYLAESGVSCTEEREETP